eukprot:TRINITY_DN25119_c0_g1_i1.p1 TRINITY_DN25119_c0_g1~~TRINITY_DN25119_c0_g1_i1.p1  ORF type:complete len:471 (+),score=140.34 TRINITY_DN25119_c0_g1_i1:70-1482(+)
MWVLYPCSGCKPFGVVLGLVLVGGLVLVSLCAVGRYSFTPSDMVLQYNNAVEDWVTRRRDSFDHTAAGRKVNFEVCRVDRKAGKKQRVCAPMKQVQDGEEGRAAAGGFDSYEAVYQQTGERGVLPDMQQFSCKQSTSGYGKPINLELYTDGVLVKAVDPIVFPIFAYRWTGITTEEECRRNIGIYWSAYNPTTAILDHFCVKAYVADRVCITVNRTADAAWAVTPYKTGHAAGCFPDFSLNDENSLPFVGCGARLEAWGYTGFTLLNGTVLSPQLTDGRGASMAEVAHEMFGRRPEPSPQLPTEKPYLVQAYAQLPTNLSSFKVSVRSVYDPLLVAEDITQGNLFFSLSDVGEYAFGGSLLGFFGAALLYLGVVMVTTSMLASLIIAAFFPRLRYRYLYAAVHLDRPDRLPPFVTYHNDHPLDEHNRPADVARSPGIVPCTSPEDMSFADAFPSPPDLPAANSRGGMLRW